MNKIIVESKASYIDSLLFALFNSISHYEHWLTLKPKKIKNLYLQILIKKGFVEKIRNGESVLESDISIIRNYSIICGWKEQSSLINYYLFLQSCLEQEKSYDMYHNGKSLVINLNFSRKKSSIKKGLIKWLDQNDINDVPFAIVINITKKDKSIDIDIMKRIKLNYNYYNNQRWKLKALICKNEKEYYTIITSDIIFEKTMKINTGNKWLVFGDNCVPSLQYIDIKSLKSKIMNEVVFLIYHL